MDIRTAMDNKGQKLQSQERSILYCICITLKDLAKNSLFSHAVSGQDDVYNSILSQIYQN